MNLLKHICFLVCLTLLGSFPAVADDTIVGIWSPTWRSKGNLAPQWVFTKDGNVTHTFGTLIDFKYEINDGKITSALMSPDHSVVTREEKTKTFLLDGDTLTENPESSSRKLVMKRTGKPNSGAHLIVGEWRFSDITGSPAFMRYSSAGLTQLSIPFRTYTGTYRADRDTISITLQGQPPMTLKFRWEKDLLILTDAQAKESKYLRFDY